MSSRPLAIDGDSAIYKACGYDKRQMVALKEDEAFICKDVNRANEVASKYGGSMAGDINFPQPISYTLTKAKLIIQSIIDKFDANDSYTLYLSGKQDLHPKKLIAPEYKGNREIAKPPDYNKVRDYLLEKFNSKLCVNIEPDELVVLDAYENGSIVAAMDKDILRMTPGEFYNFDSKEMVVTTELDAAYNFACYVISGDRGDNILGLNGLGEIEFNKNGEIKQNKTTAALENQMSKNSKDYKGLTHYEDYLEFYIKCAWGVYCEELKKLPLPERKMKFMKVSQLLWLPIKGYNNIFQIINFNRIFGDE